MTERRIRAIHRLVRPAVVVLAIVVDLVIWDGSRQLRGGGLLPAAVIPALVVLAHGTLLLRWRHLQPILALQWALALLGSLAVPEFQPFAGLLVALHAVASRRPPRTSVPWLASLALPFGLHSYNVSVGTSSARTGAFALLLLIWMLIGLAVWSLGRLSYASAQRAWRLRELQAAEAAEAVTAERLRLARELHDTISHAVTGMLLQAAGASALLRPEDERLRRSLAVIEGTGVQAMSELHRMLGLLHAVDPDAAPVTPGPTVSDIATLVGLAEEAGRDVQLVVEGPAGPLDPSVEVAAYRVVQECLTNSSKHAGPEATVLVRLEWADDEVRVRVADRRRGSPLPPDRETALSSGHGLRGLAERVALVGGALSSGPTEDGFVVTARLPRPRPVPALPQTVGAER